MIFKSNSRVCLDTINFTANTAGLYQVTGRPGTRKDGAVEPVCRKNQLTKTRNYRTPRRFRPAHARGPC